MPKALLLLLILFAPVLAAQSKYAIEVRSGVGELVAPPYTRVRIAISRTDTRPFNGRIVIEIGSQGMMGGGRRGGRRAPAPTEAGDVRIVHDVTLAEGAAGGLVTVDIPVSSFMSIEVTLERQVSGDYFEFVVGTDHSPTVINDESIKLVGFVSDARLAAAQDYLFYQAVEIPVAEMPDSWKSLACFDAIVVNDDRLTRAQSQALVDYMAAGGTVVLSPSGAASFNPETLAGSLLRIPATTQQKFARLNEFGELLKGILRPTGMGSAMMDPGAMPAGGGSTPTGDGTVAVPGAATLVQPPDDAELMTWPDAGRAKPVAGSMGLASIARVGAGNLVLLHTDISAAPFTGSDGAPTTACVKLLDVAMAPVALRTGRTPLRLLGDADVRDSLDIAGKRIPGRDALIIVLLLYIAVAGVGMFIVARRIRRPELYPGTLFAAAVVSVLLVFGIGEIYKRSGDRVKAARVLVSDETTDRNAMFTLGCVYAVDGESCDFVNSRKSALVPAKMDMRFAGSRGMPADILTHETSFTSTEATTHVSGLDRWQNVFFMQREPVHLEGFSVEVATMPGALSLENKSPHELRACIFLAGQPGGTPGATRCAWHYAGRIGAKGSNDARVTFSESSRLAESPEALAELLAADSEAIELEVLGAMFTLNPEDPMRMAISLRNIEDRLTNAGLLPEPDEFLLIALLPQGALDGSSIGAVDVEDGDIAEAALWMIRGGIEGR